MKRILTTLMVLGAFLAKAQNGKVGINTETPKETLHINGTLQVSNLPENGATNSIYTDANASSRTGTFTPTKMVVADVNGVLGVQDIPTSSSTIPTNNSNDNKPFYYIEFNLTNVNGDWVSSFNTKIPSNKYTLIIVGAELSAPSAYFIRTNSTEPKDFSPAIVSASVKDNAWVLAADYPSAGIVPNPYHRNTFNGSWKIKCLVINNNVVNNLGSVSQDFGGRNTSTSTVTPNDITN